MTDWISCEERFPENEVDVLIWVVKSPMRPFATISYRFNIHGVNTWAGFGACTEGVTHWMPLPLPPEEK